MHDKRFGHLASHAGRRIEGIHRPLKDHRDAPPSYDLSKFLIVEFHDVLPVKHNLALISQDVLWQEPQNRVRSGGLPGTALAHERDRLPRLERERNVVNRVNGAFPGPIPENEVLDVEDRQRHSLLLLAQSGIENFVEGVPEQGEGDGREDDPRRGEEYPPPQASWICP